MQCGLTLGAAIERKIAGLTHLAKRAMREVFWVTRAKDNLQYRVVRRLQLGRAGNILRDDLIQLTGPARKAYPVELRRVVALVEVDGELREMVFLTHNVLWSAQTVADLYRCRWSIEVFFKELKQTLQLADFLGHNARPVRWQVWTALLVYLLLRCSAFLSLWGHSFTRLFTLLRAALWQKLELRSLLERYGTAALHIPNPTTQSLNSFSSSSLVSCGKTPSDRHAPCTCGLPLKRIHGCAHGGAI